jgi:hypothetical protein
MTEQLSPITPPPELVKQWAIFRGTHYEDLSALCESVATQAANWGSDMELEACCEWLTQETPEPYINALRAARRPNPPNLKAQAISALDQLSGHVKDIDQVRRAIEQLPDTH